MIEIISEDSVEEKVNDEKQVKQETVKEEKNCTCTKEGKSWYNDFLWELIAGTVLVLLCSTVFGVIGLTVCLVAVVIADAVTKLRFKKVIHVLYIIALVELVINIFTSMLGWFMLVLLMI